MSMCLRGDVLKARLGFLIPLVIYTLTHVLPEVLHFHMVPTVTILFYDVQGNSILISVSFSFPDLC